MANSSGEIMLGRGYVFKWTMTGDKVPEIYGWTEKNYSIVPNTAGWFRTIDPEKAARIAKSNVECM